MAAARNVTPNMIRTTAPAIRPERMFFRARRRSTSGNLASQGPARLAHPGDPERALGRRRPPVARAEPHHHQWLNTLVSITIEAKSSAR